MSKFPFDSSELSPLLDAGLELIPLNAPDALDRKGRSIGKAPAGAKWRDWKPLTRSEATDHMDGGANVGVRLRETDLVVDVDPRNFEDGDDPLSRLERDLELPLRDICPTVVTGSGGLHLYMTKPVDASVRDTLEDYQGIEFKTFGRQVVAPGSVHPEAKETYRFQGGPLDVGFEDTPEATDFMLRLVARPGRVAATDAGSVEPEELSAMLEHVDATEYAEQDKWLTMMMACHHATAGEGRQEFIEWSTSDPQYAGDAWIIGRRWDSLHADAKGRRVTERTLYKWVIEAGGQETIPRDSAEDDFAGIEDAEDPEDVSQYEGDPSIGPLDRFNQTYCAVDDGGKFRVFRQKVDHQFRPPRPYWEKYARSDFENLEANVKTVSEDGKVVYIAKKWIEWGQRKTYEGVVFDPANRLPNGHKMLNLWTDWTVGAGSPKGSWDYMHEVVYEGLAGGNEAMGKYILDWIAFMVQNPDVPAEAALVFRGSKGVGKSTLGKALVALTGRHGLHISDAMHLTNHFNAHLRDCIFLFADEAMWGGDKRSEGTLKQLITEPTILFEAKGRDAVPGRNMVHVMIASNEGWVIPASLEDERRFAVGDVSDKFRGQDAFWKRVYSELYSPISDADPRPSGLARFLWDMKRRDISEFHPRRNIPVTAALAKQKLESLDYLDVWWFEGLVAGMLGRGVAPVLGDWEDVLGDGATFLTQDVQEACEEHLRRQGDRFRGKRSLQTVLGERIRKRLGPLGTKKQKRVRVPDDRPEVDRHSDGYANAYSLPPLEACRSEFERQLGIRVDWRTGQPTY